MRNLAHYQYDRPVGIEISHDPPKHFEPLLSASLCMENILESDTNRRLTDIPRIRGGNLLSLLYHPSVSRSVCC